MSAGQQIRYLLVTHIPFARASGDIKLDALWLRDLEGLRGSIGPIVIAAPQLDEASLRGWGPTLASLEPDGNFEFVGLPAIRSRRDSFKWIQVRRVLADQVRRADLVHTSNYFPPYLGLGYAHHLAVSLGKKTLFVVAEDFVDMLSWEWARNGATRFERWRRRTALNRMDKRVRLAAASASLTFLHTPAAVQRYRLYARTSMAIRQPGHSASQVIGLEALRCKQQAMSSKRKLVIVTASRHSAIKGIDFLLRALSILRQRGIEVDVRLYGEGPHSERLRKLSARLGIDGTVKMCGAIPPGPSVYAAIAEGDVFVMPHRTTDFGRAFYDAMAGGTPVLAFRSAASIDTVRDGQDGWLCPIDDPEGLAAALERLDRNRELLVAAAENARDRALRETREFWFDLRAQRVRELMEDNS